MTFTCEFPRSQTLKIGFVCVGLLLSACGKSEPQKGAGPEAASTGAAAANQAPAAAKKANKTPCAPTCSDATHAQACSEEGVASLVDCAANGRRCLRGVCSETLCKPNSLHCFEGQLYKCDETGSNRKLEKNCRDNGVCLEDLKTKVASCIEKCDKKMQRVVLAEYDCQECEYKDVPFCAKTGPETTCSQSVCNDGDITFGAGMGECIRETNGLIVPGSEKKGACENATMTVQYEVCVDGKPEKRTRIDGC